MRRSLFAGSSQAARACAVIARSDTSSGMLPGDARSALDRMLRSDVGAAEAHAEMAATTLRNDAGLDEISPVDESALRLILERACCDVEETDELGANDGGVEALLVPRCGGFTVLVDPRPDGGWRADESERALISRRRVRFRVLHEVGHTFFFDSQWARAGRARSTSTAEERFCDAFAAALLLPPAVVRRTRVSAVAAFELAETFDVSPQLAARSLATLHPKVSSVALFVESPHGLRVQWASSEHSAQAAIRIAHGAPGGPFMDSAKRGRQEVFLERLSAAL